MLILFTPLLGDTLRIAFGSYNAAPFVFLDSPTSISGGLFKDIADSISARTGLHYIFVNIPRKRLEKKLINGEVDLYLKMNPKWASDSTLFYWSTPLFMENDILLSQRDRPFQNDKSLTGVKVGTILGFQYPTLNKKFSNGTLVRNDAYSLQANIGKLKLRRIDALVDSEILILYYLKKTDTNLFYIDPSPIATHTVHGMISKSTQNHSQILTTLEELQQSGAIEKILKKYR